MINKNESSISIDLTRFDEVGLNAKTVKDVISGGEFIWGNTLKLEQKGSFIFTTRLN